MHVDYDANEAVPLMIVIQRFDTAYANIARFYGTIFSPACYPIYNSCSGSIQLFMLEGTLSKH